MREWYCKYTKFNLNTMSLSIICKHGYVNYLKYYHLNTYYDINESCLIDSVIYNNFNCVKYLIDNKICDYYNICSIAAAINYDNINILKYLHEKDIPWGNYVCCSAAESDNIKCLKYAHENGCPWDDYVIYNAAIEGNLECLKYAHKNGCVNYCKEYILHKCHKHCIEYVSNFM